MKTIELEKTKLVFFDDQIVIVEPKKDATIDHTVVKQAYDIIEENLTGNYTLIIERKNKYKLIRFEAAKEDEQRDRLKGIAVVAFNNIALQMAELDKRISKKPFVIFTQLENAIAWAKNQHD